jgi:hypothetical protein
MSNAETAANGRRKNSRSMTTRRRVLTNCVTTVAATSGTAAALWPAVSARPQRDRDITDDAPTPLFDEIYRGRRIQGFASATQSEANILIDGRLLHVMRRVDGSWISLANHFQPYATQVATARGAVDVIGLAELSTNVEHHH